MTPCGRRRKGSEAAAFLQSIVTGGTLEATISTEDITAEIRAIFESNRKFPGKPFKSKGFLTHLQDDPNIAIGDSWGGNRRRANFFEQLETRYLICFPSEAYERNWDFEKFCEWIAYRSTQPKVNLSLALRYRGSIAGLLVPVAVLIAISVCLTSDEWISRIIGATFVVASIAIGWAGSSNYRYYSKLAKQLQS